MKILFLIIAVFLFQSVFSVEYTGIAKWYTVDDHSGCNLDFDLDGPLLVTAINNEQYAEGAVCGRCIRVTNNDYDGDPNYVETLDLLVTSCCPECPKPNLDLSHKAFARFADNAVGGLSVTWEYIDCDVTGNYEIKMKNKSNLYWNSFQIRNNRVDVTNVRIKDRDVWHNTELQSWNYWDYDPEGTIGENFEVEVTSINGEKFIDVVPEYIPGDVYVSKHQFAPSTEKDNVSQCSKNYPLNIIFFIFSILFIFFSMN
ncbi:hypothetical protein M0812_02338 [Anaeramoeba flamelloides]|uniref:Expansin-like EG45 domain-containing protein n=1 Tax=Anaeramoeba flamelloides TaxID=1746091 RepID=A0AAV7YZ60_9EUKA|nr:hypothetical protein M0812_02338 [Anaeramoeba flamelloides]